MCRLCVEIAKERMNIQEARRALPEMIQTAASEDEKKHFEKLSQAGDEELKKLAEEGAEHKE